MEAHRFRPIFYRFYNALAYRFYGVWSFIGKDTHEETSFVGWGFGAKSNSARSRSRKLSRPFIKRSFCGRVLTGVVEVF